MRKTMWIVLLGLLTSIVWSAEKPVVGEPLEEAGTRFDLKDGNQLQLAVEDNNVVGYFIDSEGLLMESPAESILIVVDHTGHRNDEWRTVIKPVDKAKLTSPRVMAPPYNFKTRLIIRFKDGSTETLANAFVELESKPEDS